jgi:ankyrin repeat protein
MKKLLLLMILATASPIVAMDVERVAQAIEADNLDEARRLLNVGLQEDPDFPVGRFFQYADTVPKVTMLLDEYGADVNESYTNDGHGTEKHAALDYATSAEVVHVLVDHGADVNKRYGTEGHTVLHYAKNAEVVQALVDRGADVHACNCYEQTPLHAHEWVDGDIDIARVLLKAGADPNKKDWFNRSAMYGRYRDDNNPYTRLLMEYGGKPDED